MDFTWVYRVVGVVMLASAGFWFRRAGTGAERLHAAVLGVWSALYLVAPPWIPVGQLPLLLLAYLVGRRVEREKREAESRVEHLNRVFE